MLSLYRKNIVFLSAIDKNLCRLLHWQHDQHSGYKMKDASQRKSIYRTKRDKVVKNGPSEICGRQPLKM